ncbi:MAG: SprT-like domain-containing protein [Planctomycetota bacterium]
MRLHRMFAQAPDSVLDAIAQWIRMPGSDAGPVRAFMDANRHTVRLPQPRKISSRAVRPQGRFHKLDTLFATLNAEYFDSSLEMRVTWGRQPGRRRPRRLCLGSYTRETGLIRLSPRLDSPRVPRYFVEFVLYHEMLHAFLGLGEEANGRRRIHPPRFRRLERRFRHYEKATVFEARFFSRRPIAEGGGDSA